MVELANMERFAEVELQRRFAQELDDLRARFLTMHTMDNVHERGRMFKDFLFDTDASARARTRSD